MFQLTHIYISKVKFGFMRVIILFCLGGCFFSCFVFIYFFYRSCTCDVFNYPFLLHKGNKSIFVKQILHTVNVLNFLKLEKICFSESVYITCLFIQGDTLKWDWWADRKAKGQPGKHRMENWPLVMYQLLYIGGIRGETKYMYYFFSKENNVSRYNVVVRSCSVLGVSIDLSVNLRFRWFIKMM